MKEWESIIALEIRTMVVNPIKIVIKYETFCWFLNNWKIKFAISSVLVINFAVKFLGNRKIINLILPNQ